jgi:hypothetical protein
MFSQEKVQMSPFQTYIISMTYLIGRGPRAPRPYLFLDGTNMYNQIVLVYTVNVYIPANLGRPPILWYQVLQVL